MPEAPLLLYDGRCGFCRAWSRRLARWDGQGRIRQLPAQERHLVKGIPPLSDQELDLALHVILPDGRVVRGARGIIALLPWLRGGRWLGMLAAIPGVAPVADRVYRWVGARRHRLGREGDHCELR